MITGENFIGKTRSATGSKQFSTFDPVKAKPNPEQFFVATEKEIDDAVNLAASVFPVYSDTSAEKRAGFLRAIADEISELGDSLIDCYCRESGLPEGRAAGERGRTLNQLRSFADYIETEEWRMPVIETADPGREPNPRPDLRNALFALGPIAVFGAGNFPFAFSTAGGDTASALAAGCPVVYKCHPMHAGTSEMVASAIIRAAERTGIPDGVFSHLHSQGTTVGQQLVAHPGIKAVGFTGSMGGGKALYDLAAQREEPIPVFAEMGSINPVLLLPQAMEKDAKGWADKFAASITLGAGQFCTNPGLFISEESPALDRFIGALSMFLEDKEQGTMLHPDIHQNYLRWTSLQKKQPNTQIVSDPGEKDQQYKAAPVLLTVSGLDFIKNPGLQHEVFGPFSLVVKCSGSEEVQEVINVLQGQLTATVIGNPTEMDKYSELVKDLQSKAGRLLFNGVPTGVEVSEAMQHGGPYPATTDSRFTSVGMRAIYRWVRPVCYQDCPQALLPDILKNGNPLGASRKVNGQYTTQSI
ncbi:aldehyde dehydrogenase (NADP(+)) [Zeaxanthinibacter enoshimensis]|uniref:NADP-dependent aldehyde dehydrogenase n=1 Tax=Zeaxanthinibacter enoshimensis TaxID=392009 RepID=A0A4R6TK29_9FLAO|nr:aldehyde dehydrogenase (NADP(+)) [Zeaxanthinibacter enoshimensis]TDQ31254.1 NADP-dependent aldehyde dehydrogenase [Zeaxanthinibacter enoshimensis]